MNTRVVQLFAWKGALSLEMKGLSRRGRSVYSIVKQECGFKGSKPQVYRQLVELCEDVLAGRVEWPP